MGLRLGTDCWGLKLGKPVTPFQDHENDTGSRGVAPSWQVPPQWGGGSLRKSRCRALPFRGFSEILLLLSPPYAAWPLLAHHRLS